MSRVPARGRRITSTKEKYGTNSNCVSSFTNTANCNIGRIDCFGSKDLEIHFSQSQGKSGKGKPIV